MTKQSPRIYIYKITFEEVPYYYYGVKKEEYYNQEYWGSPKTHKWCWELYTPKKQILEVFDYTDEGWLEAQEVEKRLIQPVFNTDKWCLNENCGGRVSLGVLRESGNKCYELCIGVHGRTKKERIEHAKIGGQKSHELCIGVHGRTKKERIEHAKIGGQKSHELCIGVHGRTKKKELNMEN